MDFVQQYRALHIYSPVWLGVCSRELVPDVDVQATLGFGTSCSQAPNKVQNQGIYHLWLVIASLFSTVHLLGHSNLIELRNKQEAVLKVAEQALVGFI